MNKSQFYQYLSNVNSLNAESLGHLNELVAEYPFFHAGRMMLVKNLHLLENIKYDNELRHTAIFIPDRKCLYKLVHRYQEDVDLNKNIINNKTGENSKVEIKDQLLNKNVEPDENYFGVSDQVVSNGNTIDYSDTEYNWEVKEDDKASSEFLDYEIPVSISQYEIDTSQLDVNKNHSFIEWLTAMSQGQISEGDSQAQPKSSNQMDLIDSFLSKGQDKIVPASDKYKENIDFSESSTIENDELMTETLANIYIKQKHYKKALVIFEKLILKYPEKNIYFASRIKELENLISNQ